MYGIGGRREGLPEAGYAGEGMDETIWSRQIERKSNEDENSKIGKN
jgi:hypothetical protein